MRFVRSRALWFLATVVIVTPILVAAHTETGRTLLTAVLFSLVTAVAIGGLIAALLGLRDRPGPTGQAVSRPPEPRGPAATAPPTAGRRG